MGSNSFGKIFTVTSFGESHGPGIGVVIDGCPAGIMVDKSLISQALERRRTGQAGFASSRKEQDEFQVLSGVFDGQTTGAPLTFFIPNTDARSEDYIHLRDVYRPSHADFTYDVKYGIRDYRGGGRSSARVTAGWVVAGAVASMLLKSTDVRIQSYVTQIGEVELKKPFSDLDLALTEHSPVRCPHEETAQRMLQYLEHIRSEGDTCGGIITTVVRHIPTGWGEPVFDKLQAMLGKAMLSLNAVKGFEYGSGFAAAAMRGSQHNDTFVSNDGHISTKTNFSGGIQGGISNGNDVYFRVAFKPVATIMQQQESVDSTGQHVTVQGKGRHDACVVPRAVPVVEALTAMVLADAMLMNKVSAMK